MSSYPPSYPVNPTHDSTTAVISIITGILGLTLLPFVGSIIAVITGHMALGEISRSNGAIGGRGAAVMGLVLGYIGIVGFALVGICGTLFFLGICTLPFLTIPFADPQDFSSVLRLLA
jgi:hypothetical protein